MFFLQNLKFKTHLLVNNTGFPVGVPNIKKKTPTLKDLFKAIGKNWEISSLLKF